MARTRGTIGLDVGTSSLKGVVLAEDGRIVATGSAPYPLATPRPGWTEQSPERWWQACCAVIDQLKEAADVELVALGLSGQMHGAVFLDSHGEVIRPAMLWNDARSGDEAQEIEARVGEKRLLSITGNRPSASFQATKVLWMAANEPGNADRVASILLPKDYIRWRLTGERATDASDASGTLLLDLANRRWSGEILHLLGIEDTLLPEVYESREITGRVSVAAAAATGLPEGLPVVAGGGDNACAALGMGLVEGSGGGGSLGSSATIFVRSDEPLVDPKGVLNGFCDAAGGWHLMGVVLSAGTAIGWCVRTLYHAEEPSEAEAVSAALANVPPGADGLLFMPHLSGERAPYRDARARGGWIGLTLAHGREHMMRAAVEGVGFAIAACFQEMRGLGAHPPQVTLAGGGARNEAWRQLLADQLDVPLAVSTTSEAPALGAAMLAAVGGHIFADLPAAASTCVRGAGISVTPESSMVHRYRDIGRRWGRLHPAIQQAGLL